MQFRCREVEGRRVHMATVMHHINQPLNKVFFILFFVFFGLVGVGFCVSLSLSLPVSCTLLEGVQAIFSFFSPYFVQSGHKGLAVPKDLFCMHALVASMQLRSGQGFRQGM